MRRDEVTWDEGLTLDSKPGSPSRFPRALLWVHVLVPCWNVLFSQALPVVTRWTQHFWAVSTTAMHGISPAQQGRRSNEGADLSVGWEERWWQRRKCSLETKWVSSAEDPQAWIKPSPAGWKAVAVICGCAMCRAKITRGVAEERTGPLALNGAYKTKHKG